MSDEDETPLVGRVDSQDYAENDNNLMDSLIAHNNQGQDNDDDVYNSQNIQ